MMIAEIRPAAGRLALTAVACTLLLAACQAVTGTSGHQAGVSSQAGLQVAQIRSRNGLPALVPDSGLEKVALQQAANMARVGRMTHSTGWRRDFVSRVRAGGVGGAAAENIAAGQRDVGSVLSAWMDSPGHRRNILDPRFRRFGLAYATGKEPEGRRFWTMVVAD